MTTSRPPIRSLSPLVPLLALCASAGCGQAGPALPAALVTPSAAAGRLEVIENSLGMKLVRIPAGEFQMGSPDSDPEALDDEKPRHRALVDRAFYLGMHEVTRGQFRRFVEDSGYVTEAEKKGGGYAFDYKSRRLVPDGRGSWRFTGFDQQDNHPVVNVSWHDAVAFCEWLSKKEKATYRLPTETEWEFACRAGTETVWATGDAAASLEGAANVCDAELEAIYPFATWSVKWNDGYAFTAPVGVYPPNAFGLCDMVGNVFEYCSDPWPEKTYDGRPLLIAEEPPEPDSRVIRGGSYLSLTKFLRSADRVGLVSWQRNCIVGFRVARTIPGPSAPTAGDPAP